MTPTDEDRAPAQPAKPTAETPAGPVAPTGGTRPGGKAREIGGPAGLEPTRYGDWEVGGRCSDF